MFGIHQRQKLRRRKVIGVETRHQHQIMKGPEEMLTTLEETKFTMVSQPEETLWEHMRTSRTNLFPISQRIEMVAMDAETMINHGWCQRSRRRRKLQPTQSTSTLMESVQIPISST